MATSCQQVGIERIFHGAELKNEQAMETVLSAAIKASTGEYCRLCGCTEYAIDFHITFD